MGLNLGLEEKNKHGLNKITSKIVKGENHYKLIS